MLGTPGMCVSMWFQPRLIKRRPSIPMSERGRLSLAPQNRGIQDTAGVLSSRNRNGSLFASDVSPFSSSMTHDVTTVPKNSNRMIVIVQVSRRSAFLFRFDVSSFGKCYHGNPFLLAKIQPFASKQASDRQFLFAGFCIAV